MPPVLRPLLLGCLSAFALAAPAAAQTAADDAPGAHTGGVSAEFATGGSADSSRAGALAYGAPVPRRPVVRLFRVTPRSVREGSRPRIRLRIDERGVRTVTGRIAILRAGARVGTAQIVLGRVRTNRTVTVAWPERVKLRAGSYTVRLHARDPHGETLARAANASGKVRLEVRRRPRPEKSQPAPQPKPTPSPSPATTPAAPIGSGVFPVAGPHTYGGDGSRFGAGRKGHSHEGQDIAAAAGLPVVAPVAGTVAFVDFQAGGAGHYVVLNADDGRAMFFAHLQTGSIGVTAGQRVAPATTLGRVGSTGSSSGPHLHFEIWEGGWRDRGGRPVDPLAQLQAWDR